jgi:Flp pilus assembly protein TadG
VFARPKPSFARDTGGASAVEFALVAPVFLVLMFGAIQIAIMMHNASSVQWAIERAARSILVDATITEVKLQELVDANLAGIGSDAEVDVSFESDPGAEVALTRVTATYSYPLAILFLPKQTLSFVTDVTVPRPA